MDKVIEADGFIKLPLLNKVDKVIGADGFIKLPLVNKVDKFNNKFTKVDKFVSQSTN